MPCPTLLPPPPCPDREAFKHGSILSGKIQLRRVSCQWKSTAHRFCRGADTSDKTPCPIRSNLTSETVLRLFARISPENVIFAFCQAGLHWALIWYQPVGSMTDRRRSQNPTQAPGRCSIPPTSFWRTSVGRIEYEPDL